MIRWVSIASRRIRSPVVEVVLPDRRVPLRRAALQQLAAPDVVDEHVEVPVVAGDAPGETLHLRGVEMVDDDRDAGAAELRDERGRLLDRLGPVVLGSRDPVAVLPVVRPVQ